MFIAYDRFKKTKTGGQIATVLTFVIALILLFVLIFVNLGKQVHKKNTTAIAADGAAMAVASNLSSWANFVRTENGGIFKRETNPQAIWNAIVGIVIIAVSVIALIYSGGSSSVGIKVGIGLIGYGAGTAYQVDSYMADIAKLSSDYKNMPNGLNLPEAGIMYAMMRAVDDRTLIEDTFDVNKNGDTKEKIPRIMLWALNRSEAIANSKYNNIADVIKNLLLPRLGDFDAKVNNFNDLTSGRVYGELERFIEELYRQLPAMELSFAPRNRQNIERLDWLGSALLSFDVWHTSRFLLPPDLDDEGPAEPEKLENFRKWYPELYRTPVGPVEDYEKAWFYKLDYLHHQENASRDKKGWLENLDEVTEEMTQKITLIPEDASFVDVDGIEKNLRDVYIEYIEKIDNFEQEISNFRNSIEIVESALRDISNDAISYTEDITGERIQVPYRSTDSVVYSSAQYKWTDQKGDFHAVFVSCGIYPGLANIRVDSSWFYDDYIVENREGNVVVKVKRYDYEVNNSPQEAQGRQPLFWNIFKETKAEAQVNAEDNVEGAPAGITPKVTQSECTASWDWQKEPHRHAMINHAGDLEQAWDDIWDNDPDSEDLEAVPTSPGLGIIAVDGWR